MIAWNTIYVDKHKFCKEVSAIWSSEVGKFVNSRAIIFMITEDKEKT